jgi:hypothetical protein
MLTYTWKLKTLRKINASGYSDVVIQTYWEVTGTDEDGYKGVFTGATPFTPPEQNFIPYANLTEEIVLGWVQAEAAKYMDHINMMIMRQIADTKRATEDVKEEDLPWNKE